MLYKKKNRNREIIYGINAVTSALEKEPDKITAAWLVKGREDDRRIMKIEQMLNQYGIKVQSAMRHFMDEKSEGGVHQGVIIEMVATPPKDEHFLEDMVEAAENEDSSDLYLVLDGVTDPHNLGAAMRSAWAAGAKAVIVPKDKSAPFSPVARKTASGAAAVVPLIAVTNLARALNFLKEHGVEVVGMAGESAGSIFEHEFSRKTAIVMGSEESGMRRLTRENCDAIVKIPMADGVESLNVSVAAGIALFEVVRRNSLKQD